MKPYMVNKHAYSPYAARSQSGQRLLPLAFIAFLFVSFVGLTPFAEHTQLDDLSETGEGNIVRQLIYISLALLVSYLTFFRCKSDVRTLPRLIPGPIILVLVWCAITLIWSPVPSIGFRRLGLTALIIFMTFAFVKGLGPWRALQLMAFCLTAFVMTSLISGPIVPNAVHLYGEREISIVGAWRGIFYHKNHAGMAAALSVIAGFFLWRNERRKIWLIAIIGGIALLILSKSKTSLGLVIPSIIIGYYFEQYKKAKNSKYLLFLLPFLVLVYTGISLLPLNDQIEEIFGDPDSFTGRVAIWETLFMVINDYPIGGIGFSSLYQVGADTPLMNYASGWVSDLPHGHNGYLDTLATTGIIGFLLSLFAFLFRPLRQIAQTKKMPPKISGLILSLISFVIFHNFMESSLLSRDKSLWVALMVVCAIVQEFQVKSKIKVYGKSTVL